MKRMRISRVIAVVLLLALIGASASAATLPQLLAYAKSKGFSVKSSVTSSTKATLSYTETDLGRDKLTWTNGARKKYTITASKDGDKAKLQQLHLYMIQNYKKWSSCAFTLNGVMAYGYNNKKAKKVYSTQSAYRKTVKKQSELSAKSKVYVLNLNTMKFHLTTCKEVSKIKASNKKIVKDTRDNIIHQKFVPCKKCDP